MKIAIVLLCLAACKPSNRSQAKPRTDPDPGCLRWHHEFAPCGKGEDCLVRNPAEHENLWRYVCDERVPAK